jgi:hypothetical protein
LIRINYAGHRILRFHLAAILPYSVYAGGGQVGAVGTFSVHAAGLVDEARQSFKMPA